MDLLAHFKALKPPTRQACYRQYARLVPAIEFAALQKGMTARAITAEILKVEADRDHKPGALYCAVCYHIRKARQRLRSPLPVS